MLSMIHCVHTHTLCTVMMLLSNITSMEKCIQELLLCEDRKDMKKMETGEERRGGKQTVAGAENSLTSERGEERSSAENSLAFFIARNFCSYNPQIEPDVLHGSLVHWEEIDEWQYGGNILCNLRWGGASNHSLSLYFLHTPLVPLSPPP